MFLLEKNTRALSGAHLLSVLMHLWRRYLSWGCARLALLLGVFAVLSLPALAQETVCARVKMQIKQELTLERQAFDAEMKIINTLDTTALDEVSIVVKVTDEAGVPVVVSEDPNNLNAKFFVRVSGKENITDIAGAGVVFAKTTAIINWLLIPAPGAAGSLPAGKKYLVGATLTYKFGTEVHTLDVSPAVITVKPMPLLTLDYFLTRDVLGDDPLTQAIEPTEPFTLGLRVKNNGIATAKNLKVDSAQPKIIENVQDLLINFKITGSYLNDTPAQNTLLLNFGDILGSTSKTGRWLMESSLAGRFTEFTATFSHADELGGALTSLMQGVYTHFLIRDVRVDLPGRDTVKDFLAQDIYQTGALTVYESDAPDSPVTDLSTQASLNVNGQAYRLTSPATAGFSYVKLPDPFSGQKALGTVRRSDGKPMLSDNVWLSKTQNPNTKQWNYWVNFFDVNSTGIYDTDFVVPQGAQQPPAIQFIPDFTVDEEKQVSFLMEASSLSGRALTLSAAPLPTGATLVAQAPSSNLFSSVFDWTPPKGSAGTYLIVFTANDGVLSSSRSATITVKSIAPPPGPTMPTIVSPAFGAQVAFLRPTLSVQPSSSQNDPTTQIVWEIYSDVGMTQRVDTSATARPARVNSVVPPAVWQLSKDLLDNTPYWWRARAFDGTQTYSAWVNGQLFVNLFNDAPNDFNLSSPAQGIEVTSVLPVLSWSNSVDPDGDSITYQVKVAQDAGFTTVVASVNALPAAQGNSTSWTVDVPLSNHATYYWLVTAVDTAAAQKPAIPRSFVVNTGNAPPTDPAVVSPIVGSQSPTLSTPLVVLNSTDSDGDLLSYVFEIDTVNTFDSGDKRSSGQLMQGGGATTAWIATGLIENKRYFWRAKVQDGRAESAWVGGDFMANVMNEAPPTPTVKNPGSDAWVGSLQPTLEVNPVLDPETDAVTYQFEVYRDAALTMKVTDGTSSTTSWTVSSALTDKTTHWWRARAVDALNATSNWGPATRMYVSTGTYQNPTIQVTSPAVPSVPDVAGSQKQVTVRWTGTDPNIEPIVALYYGTDNTSYYGNLIVDGLKKPSGTHSGSYIWDVTALVPGTYYIYAVIYDSRGVGQAFAPGALVIPPAQPSGQLVVNGGPLQTAETGTQGTFKVRLGNTPTADVVVPLSASKPSEGALTPASLTFTPANWNVEQTVVVKGKDDCLPDGAQQYNVVVGKAVSTDMNYIGLTGAAVQVTNSDNSDRAGTTTSTSLHICSMTIVSQLKVGSQWEYVLKADMTNMGADLLGVNATATSSTLSSPVTFVDGSIVFGAVASGETVRSTDTITVRTIMTPANFAAAMSAPFRWSTVLQY